MKDLSHSVEQVNNVIQKRLRNGKLGMVDPVTATRWLIEEGIRSGLEQRPGSYLRNL